MTEPTFEDLLRRDDIEREITALHALSELAHWAHWITTSKESYTRWEYLYKALFNLKLAAVGTYQKGNLHITSRHRAAWNLQFARIFLKVYVTPRLNWRFH